MVLATLTFGKTTVAEFTTVAPPLEMPPNETVVVALVLSGAVVESEVGAIDGVGVGAPMNAPPPPPQPAEKAKTAVPIHVAKARKDRFIKKRLLKNPRL